MPGLEDIAGRAFGPFQVDVSASRVRDLVEATGDDPDRWTGHAPPSFANAILFEVAPAFLDDEMVRRFTRSLIHSDQAFSWAGPLPVGGSVEVHGVVESIRERSGINLATFSLEATSDQGPWLRGSSVFLLSDSTASRSDDEPEPAPGLRPAIDTMTQVALPHPGEQLGVLRVGAARIDLVKYAAATGDWNPIHWDHDSARNAGLPGTIAHGLLMTAWLGRAASRFASGPHPLASMRARFRSPLRPGASAEVTGTVVTVDETGAELDLALASGGDRKVTARVRVTR
ncbi:MAG TPA: MaoC/PaaZ C-terminal domain-containing protein [Acidimicrobiia bacterium]|nr:MaoC/PaaZ C-terminal domain-containing protein [Acidimicrobiia bacterium]